MNEVVHGKGMHGFQDVIMDEVHDIIMELGKKVSYKGVQHYKVENLTS